MRLDLLQGGAMTFDSERNQFSLRGLLAVVGISSVLLALLVPWLNQMREAERRTLCSSRQKRIALAINLYHDTNRVYPSSAFPRNGDVPIGEKNAITQYVPGSNKKDTAAPFSFLVSVLPYLESKTPFVDIKKDAFDPTNHAVAATYMPLRARSAMKFTRKSTRRS